MVNFLEIPDYKAILPNTTWGKETEPIENPMSKEMYEATEIIQISRFKVPSESEAIKSIQTIARHFLDYRNSKELEEDFLPLGNFLRRLSSEEIEKIVKGEEDLINHFKRHYHQGSLQPRRTYIQCKSSAVPNEALQEYADEIKKYKEAAYESIINHFSVRGWNFRIRLNGMGKLPKKEELESLLDQGVRECYIFRTNVKYKNYQDMANQALLVYEALNQENNLEKLAEVSKKILINDAYSTLSETYSCIMSKEMPWPIGGPIGMIGDEDTGDAKDYEDEEGDEDDEDHKEWE